MSGNGRTGTTPDAAFGPRLRALREAAGLTQEEADDEPARAARLLGAAEALLESAGVPRYAMVDQDLHGRVADAARGRFGEQAWEEARDEGRAMSFEEAVTFVFEEDPAPA